MSEHELLELLNEYLDIMGLSDDFDKHLKDQGYKRGELPPPFDEE